MELENRGFEVEEYPQCSANWSSSTYYITMLDSKMFNSVFVTWEY